jgi:hypothetical protein
MTGLRHSSHNILAIKVVPTILLNKKCLMYNCKMSSNMTVREYYERMYRISTLMEFFPKRKIGTAPTPLTHEEFKMAIEQGLSPAICVEMFGMENTIDDTTESSLLPFLEVLELKTQIKLATVKNFITTKQDQKRPEVSNKTPLLREHKKCEGHKDACGKLGHTWYECFNNPKNLHKRPKYWNKKPSSRGSFN